MSSSLVFTDFLPKFFELFAGKSFRGGNYLTYLRRPVRSGDEASIVDTAIVGPLLGLLGFEPAERVYNQQRQNGRPDFAPTSSLYGTCFVIEDKSTSLDLTFDLSDPDSHLSQLAGYVRSAAVSLGWLTNGRQLTVWSFENPNRPTCIIDLDIVTSIQDWYGHTPPALSTSIEKSLHALFDLCRKESFSDLQRIEQEIGKSLEEWQMKGLFGISEHCDLQATISSNVYIPDRYPTSLVLRHNKLWYEVPDENLRRYLLNYLSGPQWRGKTWDDIKNTALIPEGSDALNTLLATETQQVNYMRTLLDEIKRIDEEIDERVLDLYGITNAADRQRILGSAPVEEEEIASSDNAVNATSLDIP